MGFSGTFPFLHPVPGMRRLREVITDTERAQEPALDARAQPLTTVVGPVAAGLGAWSGSQLMFESLPDPLLLLVPEKSPSGTIINVVCVWANAPACALHGRTQQGMLGTRLLDAQPSTGLFTPGLLVMETGQAVVIEGLDGSGHGGLSPGTLPRSACFSPTGFSAASGGRPAPGGRFRHSPGGGGAALSPADASRLRWGRRSGQRSSDRLGLRVDRSQAGLDGRRPAWPARHRLCAPERAWPGPARWPRPFGPGFVPGGSSDPLCRRALEAWCCPSVTSTTR